MCHLQKKRHCAIRKIVTTENLDVILFSVAHVQIKTYTNRVYIRLMTPECLLTLAISDIPELKIENNTLVILLSDLKRYILLLIKNVQLRKKYISMKFLFRFIQVVIDFTKLVIMSLRAKIKVIIYAIEW